MSYSPTDKPTLPQLCRGLSDITDDWQCFAILLPGIQMRHIGLAKNDHQGTKSQKMAVFQMWLELHPGATWNNVYDALVIVDKVSLARSLVKVDHQSVSHVDSSPMSLPHTPQPPVAAVQQSLVTPQPTRIHITDDSAVEQSLESLFTSFKKIAFTAQEELCAFVSQEPGRLQRVIRYSQTIGPLTTAKLDSSSFDEFFCALRPYYDFLDCGVLRDIVEMFIEGKLAKDLQAHSAKAREFRRTAPIKQLAREVYQIITRFQDLPTLEAKLETPWEDVVIEGLYVLIQHLLPNAVKKHPQYSLMNNIVILPGCLLLRYGIRDRSMIDAIIQHVQHNTDFMTLIGVFQLAIDGRYAIFEEEDHSFSFNTSLYDATKVSNNAAVQCLLDIGANVNYQEDEGATPLMWAVLRNNIIIIHELLQAGADIHIKKKDGVTALTYACIGSGGKQSHIHRHSDDYRDTVRILLSHGADPLAASADVDDGMLLSPFDTACGCNATDIVEMLLIDYDIPPEAVVRGLYWALLGVAINTVKLLQPKVPHVDPLAIKLGASCGAGDIETVKSLIEEGVGPNTDIVHGLTPLMIASDNGRINIADTLLHHGANVNMVDDITHFTALDWAEAGDYHDIIPLLEKHGGLRGWDIGSQDTPTKATPNIESLATPTNVPQDVPTTNNTPGSSTYDSLLISLFFKRFHKIRKLIQFRRPKQGSTPRSNTVLNPIPHNQH